MSQCQAVPVGGGWGGGGRGTPGVLYLLPHSRTLSNWRSLTCNLAKLPPDDIGEILIWQFNAVCHMCACIGGYLI